MMLPILISVSLAPGSYFFSADAAVAVSAAAAANPAKAIRLLIQIGIVLSRYLFCTSVASHAQACKRRFIPPDETALLRAADYD
jgi:hypothetical protein